MSISDFILISLDKLLLNSLLILLNLFKISSFDLIVLIKKRVINLTKN